MTHPVDCLIFMKRCLFCELVIVIQVLLPRHVIVFNQY